MIEREFLFWAIVGTSLISYSIGYFLWLFVHWYYDERPEKRHAELRVKAINEYNKQQKEETQGTEWTVTYKFVDGIALKPEATKSDPNSSPAKTSGEPEKEKPASSPPPPIEYFGNMFHPVKPRENKLGTCPKCKRKAVLMMSQDCCYRCY